MNSAPGAIDHFVHVRIVMGIVVGLGITRLLTGLAAIAQNPNRAKVSPLHLLWTLFVLVELVLFWWWEIALIETPHWSFGTFAFVIGYAITLFLMVALLVPDKMDDYEGYEHYFLSRRHWFFGAFAARVRSGRYDPQGPRLRRQRWGRLLDTDPDQSGPRGSSYLDRQPPFPPGHGAAAACLSGLVDLVTLLHQRLSR